MMVDNNDAIIVTVEAFRLSVVVSSPPRLSSSSSSSPIKSDNYYDDFDVENGNVDNNYHLLASLRQRRRSLNSRLYDRWTSGNTTSSRIGFTINESFYNNSTSRFDWVRKLAIGTYPRVVCGSASGAIYVADVEEGKLLASASCAHYPSTSCNDDDEDDDDDLLEGEDNFALLRFLYGDYDGGGVLAVAMTSSPVHSDRSVDLIASAGREGGVKLHEVVRGSDELKYIGSVPMCSDDDNHNDDDNSVIITCLKFDSVGRLYAGGGDGRLRVTIFDNDNSNKEVGMRTTLIPSQVNPSSSSSFSSLWKWKQGELDSAKYLSPILAIDISESLNMIATAHANGDVCVYSLHNGVKDDDNALTLLGVWNPFADTNDSSHARSVTFVSCGREQGENDVEDDIDDANPSWSIVVGGGNGQMWVQELHPSYYANDGTTTTSTTMSSITMNREGNIPLFLENTMQQIKPPHNGPVVALASRSVALASRSGGVLVSAGHDGVLRVSQISTTSCTSKQLQSQINPERVPPPKALYGLGGYKVWIGNICIDDEGKRLLSDGRDDVVVVHDFSLKDDDK